MAILTDKNELITLADGDFFHTADVSDDSGNVAGTSKKIKAENIKNYIGVASNVVVVNSEADFGTPSGGVITFGASDNGKTFLLNQTVIMTSRFVIEDGISITIESISLFGAALVNLTTGTIFTSNNFASLNLKNIVIVASTAKVYDLISAVGVDSTLFMTTAIVTCKEIGGISCTFNGNFFNFNSFEVGATFDFTLRDVPTGITMTTGGFTFRTGISSTTWLTFIGAPSLLSINITSPTFSGIPVGDSVFDFQESLSQNNTIIQLSNSAISNIAGDFFKANSLDQTYIYASFNNNGIIPDSTVKGKLRFIGNSLPTTITVTDQEEPIATNVPAELVFAERILAQDELTFDNATNTLNTTFNHGLILDDRVFLNAYVGSTLPAELDETTEYYVVNPTATSYQLSLTAGGAVVAFTDNGSGTLHYRHGVGSNSELLHLIYIGIEDVAIGGSGWTSIINTINSNDDVRGVIMKINLDGSIVENEIASKINVNNTRPQSSQTSDILNLSTGEGFVLYQKNSDNTNNLIAEDILINIQKT